MARSVHGEDVSVATWWKPTSDAPMMNRFQPSKAAKRDRADQTDGGTGGSEGGLTSVRAERGQLPAVGVDEFHEVDGLTASGRGRDDLPGPRIERYDLPAAPCRHGPPSLPHFDTL
jgi:hypothetical protein